MLVPYTAQSQVSPQVQRIRDKIREEARREGRREGQIEGKATTLLEILEQRRLELDAHARQRILTCTDPVILDCWVLRALTAPTLALIFA